MIKTINIFFIICSFFLSYTSLHAQNIPKNYQEKRILSLFFGKDVFRAPHWENILNLGPSCFSINNDQTKLVIADPLSKGHILKIYDLKTGKLLLSFCKIPPHQILSPRQIQFQTFKTFTIFFYPIPKTIHINFITLLPVLTGKDK